MANYVQKLQRIDQQQQRPAWKKGMEAVIKEAIELIVEASIDCCTQIGASKFSRFFSTTVNGKALTMFQKRLADTHTHMQDEMNTFQCDVLIEITMCLRKFEELNYSKYQGAGFLIHRVEELKYQKNPKNTVGSEDRLRIELKYPGYPKFAVGIEDLVREVIERLEMGSDKNAVAVIMDGFGGIGKTTLADAVFAQLFDANRGYKYSYVRLFDDLASTPNIVKLQKSIIKDLKMGEEPKYEFRTYEQGQIEIKSILEEEVVFIYIDNVLLHDKEFRRVDALEQLLPEDMGNAKKLRLLITAREKDAERIIARKNVKTKPYAVQRLPEEGAAELFKNTLGEQIKQLDPREIDEIVQICGGVPKLLKMVAGFISCENDTKEAYMAVMDIANPYGKYKVWEYINYSYY